MKNLGKSNQKGFTLVEIIVVIVILGVLMAILVPKYIQYVEKSRKAVCESNRAELERRIETDVSTAESGGVALTALSDFASLMSGEYKDKKICPDGGTITFDAQIDGTYIINCSKHPAEETSTTIASSFSKLDLEKIVRGGGSTQSLKSYLDTNNKDLKKTVDSEATSSSTNLYTMTAAVNSALKNMDSSYSADSYSWQFKKTSSGYVLYVTKKLTSSDVGTSGVETNIFTYDTSGKYTGTTTGTATVINPVSGGKTLTYPAIGTVTSN